MRKILKLTKREYLAAVRTKGFIISLVIVPIMMSGSGIAMAFLNDRVDTKDQKIAIVDRSGNLAAALLDAAEKRNQEETVDQETGRKMRPAFLLETIAPNDADPDGQRLELSERVRRGDLHAFLEIGPDLGRPDADPARSRIAYYAQAAALDETRNWLAVPINNQLRQIRLQELGIADQAAQGLFRWFPVEGLGLVTRDEATGEIREARRSGEAEAVLVPIVLPMIMFMMMLMSAVPQLGSVVEEKGQRIAEVILGSVRPFQFMMGKVLGGVATSLTAIAVYAVVAAVIVRHLDLGEFVPVTVLPWFLAYLVLAILMLGAVFSALGSACNDSREAQSLTFPGMLPVMIPVFVMMPIIQHPLTPFATWMSLIPPFTPMVMLMRLGTQQSIPAWQPWLGLVLVLLTTIGAIWAGGRIFRVAILMQGAPPKLGNLMRWAVRG
jgi:ABC-2 type transport system permease protein